MSVNIKASSEYGYDLLSLFSVSKDVIASAQKVGVEIKQTSPGIFLVSLGDVVFGNVQVKGSAISLAKNGTLGPASKQSLKYQFEQALKKAIDSGVAPIPTGVAWVEEKEEAVGFNTPSPPKPSPIPQTGTPSEALALMASPPVALHTATKLYQPVMGKSANSKYFVLAMFKGLNLAVRLKQSRVSFRCEGKLLKQYQSALDDLGFSVKEGYASVHFEVPDSAMSLKTIGAVIGRVGFNNLLGVVPDPIVFMNKGV